MSLKYCREASGLQAKEVVHILRENGSRVDKALYSHCEHEHVDLNSHDRAVVAELLQVPVSAVATTLAPSEVIAKSKRTHKPRNPELRHRVTPQQLRQIDEDVQVCGYADRQAWIKSCIYRLHVEARKAGGRK